MKKGIIFTFLYALSMLVIGLFFKLDIGEINPQLEPNVMHIISNNMLVEFKAIFLSIITFGVYSLIYLAHNFIFLGIGLKLLITDYSIGHALVFLLPHGFIEIPIMILTGFIGWYIPLYIAKSIYKKKKINIKQIIIILILIIISTIIAGIIEGYITPIIIKSVL